jgi:hypothetical protein
MIRKNKKGAVDFRISGFIIGIICIAMIATALATFSASIQTQYEITGTNTIASYADTSAIINQTEAIKDSTIITPTTGVLDIIGGFFTSGYAALQITGQSFGLFEGLMSQAVGDIPSLGIFQPFIIAIILVGLFVGVMISALLKKDV